MAEVKREHRELAANICFTRPLGNLIESYVTGDRVTYRENSLFACMVAVAQAIVDAEERGRLRERADVVALLERNRINEGYRPGRYTSSEVLGYVISDIESEAHIQQSSEE